MSLHELGYLPQKLFTKACDDLVGVDTEAAEQAFHIASRWQANLSNAHATHFDLQLLLFTYEHNERNRCDLVYKKYVAAQRQTARSQNLSSKRTEDEVPCREASQEGPRRKKRFMFKDCAESSCKTCVPDAADTLEKAKDQGQELLPPMQDAVGRDFLGCEYVYVNAATDTVHVVICKGKGVLSLKCSYVPPFRAKPELLERLKGTYLYTCGTCCGGRYALELD